MSSRTRQVPAETFSAFFEPPRKDTWRIRGSGVTGAPDEAPRTSQVIAVLRGLGVEVEQSLAASMGGGDQYDLDAPFLDGGLSARTGPYFGGEKGAWLSGRRAVALVAAELRLRVTPRHGLQGLEPAKLRAELDRQAQLMRAYRATRYTAQLPDGGSLTLTDGQRCPELDDFMGKRSPTHWDWAFVTAFNPRSVKVSATENERAMARLRAELRQRQLPVLEGAGVGEGWEEPSLLVLGLARDAAVELARGFGQNAIVVGRRFDEARVVWCNPAG